MKTSESEWSNQRQEDLICSKKFLPGKIRGNDMYLTKVQYHEMPATINVRYLTRYMLQNVSSSAVQNNFQLS